MLTKQMLLDWNLRVELDPAEECGYSVYHTAVKAGPTKYGKLMEKKLSICKIYGKHKYVNNLDYYSVGFCDGKLRKHITLTLQRVVYAWFKGDIPDGYEIDHIDANRLNNKLDNLQCLTVKQNRQNKRHQCNQWSYIKKETNNEQC